MWYLILSSFFLSFLSFLLQIDALTPIAEAVQEFTKDYTTFATAVDTTRHELPVKNFYIDKDGREFLGFWDCTCFKAKSIQEMQFDAKLFLL